MIMALYNDHSICAAVSSTVSFSRHTAQTSGRRRRMHVLRCQQNVRFVSVSFGRIGDGCVKTTYCIATATRPIQSGGGSTTMRGRKSVGKGGIGMNLWTMAFAVAAMPPLCGRPVFGSVPGAVQKVRAVVAPALPVYRAGREPGMEVDDICAAPRCAAVRAVKKYRQLRAVEPTTRMDCTSRRLCRMA